MHTDIQIIKNPGSLPLKVWLEPWVEHVEIPPKSEAEFRAQSNEAGQLEIVPGEIPVVYGWSGSSLSVVVEGKTIWESYASAPTSPRGMSMRNLVDILFGKEK